MENIDLTSKVKNFIRFGLIGLLAASGVIGYGMFQHYHADKILEIENAKVTGNMISAHVLTNGKVKELPFADGEEVKAGDVIARIEVSVTEEDIKKLEQAVDLAKRNYDSLKMGQRVKTPVRRTKPAAATPAPRANSNTASIKSLEERARRMDELYEMGAVSSSERDKAREDLAKARVSSATSQNSSAAPSATVEIDFVDSIQPTPPAILASAENAVKQAEMALNAAVQQSKQTEITAPVDGVVYYSVTADEEIKAGDIVAKIGDDHDIWIEAEVTEEIFNQISLGKKVNYSIDGHELSGTVTEKISPPEPEEIEVAEVTVEEIPAENSPEQTPPAEEKSSTEQPAENSPPEENKSPGTYSEEIVTEEISEEIEEKKFFIRVSIPAKRDFDCKLLSETTLKITL